MSGQWVPKWVILTLPLVIKSNKSSSLKVRNSNIEEKSTFTIQFVYELLKSLKTKKRKKNIEQKIYRQLSHANLKYRHYYSTTGYRQRANEK